METTKERVEQLREITKIQCTDGNWNYDEYMLGMANGMILALATMEGTEPDFKEAPDQYLKQNEIDAIFLGAEVTE